MLFRETFKENLDWYRSYTWLKIEKTLLTDSKPISNVFCVCKCGAKSHKPYIIASLLSDISHTGDNDLNYWTTLLSQQMDFINDNKRYVAHIRSMLPVSADSIPLFRCSD